ncbi:hypothetical protein FALBO_13374 [Fusarium albosuccineum]|uniref:Uncharacterized protein n=1 Tax=Fusarium albosuccineum TaxID=1237068 RepID=A0A8H4L1N9_9HYPO|nr:hypothetical protein FALBO_13374 [Fusarium albosuccineum]
MVLLNMAIGPHPQRGTLFAGSNGRRADSGAINVPLTLIALLQMRVCVREPTSRYDQSLELLRAMTNLGRSHVSMCNMCLGDPRRGTREEKASYQVGFHDGLHQKPQPIPVPISKMSLPVVSAGEGYLCDIDFVRWLTESQVPGGD